MINNYPCQNCTHALVCKKREILDKFSEDAKKPLGITITVVECSDFEEIE